MVAIKDIKKTELMWPYNIGCEHITFINVVHYMDCLLYTSPSPRDRQKCRMPSSA